MFLGNNVRDQDFDYAQFENLSSSPATFDAAKSCDALSLLQGYEQTLSDAVSAYTQEFLGGGQGP